MRVHIGMQYEGGLHLVPPKRNSERCCGRLARRLPMTDRFGGLSMLLRMMGVCLMAGSALPMAAQISAPAGLNAAAERQLPALTETYRHLHENPELSGHEVQTAEFVAGELRKLGYTVTEHVGKYEDGSQAEGVVAVLENGKGPRVMLRTELDALPVEEKTGLDLSLIHI